jgi:hypothetical protein
MYWDETTDQRAKSWTTHAPNLKLCGVASRERQEYRLAVYRRAQERFREMVAGGAVTRTTATWRALQEVCATYDLEPAEWGMLIRCLMITAS